ncbi:MAG: hypothetical protein J5I53_00435 [Bradyrhizobiaceae bacterium]|nr:hypothetical protein [Bradyrhizobiaceae bacterium]
MIRTIVFAILFAVCTTVVVARPNGYASRFPTSTPGCGGCHGYDHPNASVTLHVQGADAPLVVEAGKRTEFSVVIAHDTAQNAGINIAVTTRANGVGLAGVVDAIPETQTRVSSEQIVHSFPHTMTDSAVFTFGWTAPAAPGTYYIQAVGMAGNGNMIADEDDRWAWMEPVMITVTPSTNVDDNESSTHQDLAALWRSGEQYSLTVYTINGSMILPTENHQGFPSTQSTGLPGGLYLLEIQTRRHRSTTALFLN